MIEDLIRRARRRFLLNETLAQSAFAAAVLVGGFVLMLIFGTQYLEWWTLGIFAVAGVAIGSYRVRQRTPGRYATAVQVDENAHLHDALSTALHFGDHSAGSEQFRQSQRKQAEDAAGGVQLDQAVPFVFPRSLYVMAALCLLATTLITLRYDIGHGLDLRAPITQLFFEDQAIRDAKKAQALYPKSKNWMDEAQSLLSKLGMAQNPDEPKPGDEDALDKAIDQALQNPAEANAKAEKGGGQGDKSGQTKAGEAQSDSPNGDPIDNGDQANNNDQNGQEGANAKDGQQGSKSTSGKNGSPGNKESLLSRLKDAVSNMLSKSDKNEDNSPSSQKNQQSAKKENQNGQKGQAGKGAQEKGESQSDAEGQPDADSQSGQQAQGKLSNSANQTPQRGGSGIGSQDGSKEIKAVAQLKAMGKISEIIGQRAATVSGETSVEVQSGNQKLHTDYSNTAAAHAETDGDVTRDEIPVALQAYVQQYFAEVRKAGAAKPKATAKQP
ncbi:MAG TPA: hypothetical protein VHY84_15705 [Bryobacteraceae bacterium]|jgi:hypothetical protein|nr:hypothetical protein [Bryobacteraceae bacterium]